MSGEHWQLVLSCEHGGNRVPQGYEELFAGAGQVLDSHRGYDLGIAPFARRLAEHFQLPLDIADVTRLLVELNRSPGHPGLFSVYSASLSLAQKDDVLERFYFPHRKRVRERIDRCVAEGGRVCHISLHSFTPELNGELRNADIGLLYDPQRSLEKDFCQRWQRDLVENDKSFRVRRNYPYRGAADAFVTSLRKRYPPDSYLGLELELNQKWPVAGGIGWERLQTVVSSSLERVWLSWIAGSGVIR